MKRVRKIVENFIKCDFCGGNGKSAFYITNGPDQEVKNIPCHLCHGTGLRIKKKIFFYPDDREF
jgi:DnaJ-class molecular chaperone